MELSSITTTTLYVKDLFVGWLFGKAMDRVIGPALMRENKAHVLENHHSLVRESARPSYDESVSDKSGNRNIWREDVSVRLNKLLGECSRAIRWPSLEPSHVAVAIGEDSVERAEKWFYGHSDPTFADLRKIARYLGCNEDWLIHGDGTMLPLSSKTMPISPKTAVEWLLDLGMDDPVTRLHLIRQKEDPGSLVIVKQYGEWRCEVLLFSGTIHLSHSIGATGEGTLNHLFITIELLYRYCLSLSAPSLHSYVIGGAEFDRICNGNDNPVAILKKAPLSRWVDDLWDEGFAPKVSYWPEWASLMRMIHSNISSDDNLRQERDLIRMGKIF